MESTIHFDNKTPKEILCEMVAKKGLQASWEVEEVQKVPSALFRAVCNVTDNVEEGYGRTKMAAEQHAALKFLGKISSAEELLTLTACWKMMTLKETRIKEAIKEGNVERPAMVADDPVSDTDDNEITGEPVGELYTMCARNKLDRPEFKDFQVGPPNKAIHTVTATVGSISSQNGRRYKKQDAKKLAAFRLLRDLRAKLQLESNLNQPELPATASLPVSN